MNAYDDYKLPRWNYQLIFEKSKIRHESEVLEKKNDQEPTKWNFRKKAMTCERWMPLCAKNEWKFYCGSPVVSASKSLSVPGVLWHYRFLVLIFLFPRKSKSMSLGFKQYKEKEGPIFL